MSSIIFVLNQTSERRRNATNDFEIDIKPEIDARSGKKEITVEEVIYPNTISTIHPRNKEEYKFKATMSFGNFIHHNTSGFMNSTLACEHDWVYIPYGHHTLEDLISFINKTLNKFDCGIKIVLLHLPRILVFIRQRHLLLMVIQIINTSRNNPIDRGVKIDIMSNLKSYLEQDRLMSWESQIT